MKDKHAMSAGWFNSSISALQPQILSNQRHLAHGKLRSRDPVTCPAIVIFLTALKVVLFLRKNILVICSKNIYKMVQNSKGA